VGHFSSVGDIFSAAVGGKGSGVVRRVGILIVGDHFREYSIFKIDIAINALVR